MAQPFMNPGYYPYGYQAQVPQPMDRLAQLQSQQQYQMPQNSQQGNGILWVQGEAGAKSYLVASGTSVLLMDSETERFFIKTMDTAGMPQPLRVFEYHEVGVSASAPPKQTEADMDNKYVTREEYNDLKGKYEELYRLLDTSAQPLTNKTDVEIKKGGTQHGKSSV